MENNSVDQTEVNSLNELCLLINNWATTKGWNEGEDSVQRKSSDIALMHSELSECLEFVRAKETSGYRCSECGSYETHTNEDMTFCSNCARWLGEEDQTLSSASDDHVPSLSGESAELADVLIRIFHYCGRRNINLGEAVRLKHEYNLSRPYKHGKNL